MSTSGLASSVTVGAAKISARYGGVIGNATIYVTPVKIQSIEVLPSKPSLAIGLTTQLTAYGTFSDGTTQQLTTGVVWTSDAISKATVDNTGLVRGVTIGTAIVKATFDGVTVSTAVTITAATLQSISVTPQSASIANGFTTQLIASGKYSDGSVKDLTGLVIWTSDVISVATVNSSGLVSSVSIGIANIAAKYNGVTVSGAFESGRSYKFDRDIAPTTARALFYLRAATGFDSAQGHPGYRSCRSIEDWWEG